MSAIKIGDQAMCRGDDGVLFQGTVIDIRPLCGTCGEWHATGERAHEAGPMGMVSEPFGSGKRLVFLATPGWPHMHTVVDEYAEQRGGVWRARPTPEGQSP